MKINMDVSFLIYMFLEGIQQDKFFIIRYENRKTN